MMKLPTALIHHAYRAPEGFDSPQLPVYKASTVIFKDLKTMRERDWLHKTGYTYGLHGTPTTFTLEERIATLEGGKFCCLATSGLAAIALVNQAVLSQGDEVLLPSNVYGPSREIARHELARWGITHRFYDPSDVPALRAMIEPQTKLLWIEAPGSVTMEFPDLAGLVQTGRERGVLTALDNTWGAGIALRGFEHGLDIVIQALTKYPSGGGDVLMGSVVTVDEALHHKMLLTHMRLGIGVSGNDAETVLRSLPSVALRYHAQDASARQLALWLRDRPEIARVLHPALEGSPGHAFWRESCHAAAGLFSVVFDAAIVSERVDRFVEALELFRIGYSWAGSTSLVVPYDLQRLRPQPGDAGVLVRFSIGLEDAGDLQADLAQALRALDNGVK